MQGAQDSDRKLSSTGFPSAAAALSASSDLLGPDGTAAGAVSGGGCALAWGAVVGHVLPVVVVVVFF
jgi:hypothetical protein